MKRVQKQLVKIIPRLFVFLVLSSSILAKGMTERKIEELKRSGEVRHRSSTKWLASLPDWVPLWMKISASEYRGYPSQVACAVKKMAKAFNDMRAAKFKNCDSYFHCRGAFDAARCGVYAATVAGHVSHHSKWKFGGVDNSYNSQAVVVGLSGGNCLNEYKYKTFGTQYQCNLPWYFQ